MFGFGFGAFPARTRARECRPGVNERAERTPRQGGRGGAGRWRTRAPALRGAGAPPVRAHGGRGLEKVRARFRR